MRHSPVKQRYQAVQRPSANRIRLMALVRLFRLSPSEVAKRTGFSRPYVARLLSPRDEFNGSPEFYRTLECKLPEVIAGRSSQYFSCPAVSVARAWNVLERLPVDEVADVPTLERAVDRLFPEGEQAA